MPKYAAVVSIEKARSLGNACAGETALEHLDGLYRFALRLTRDPHLAEDLTQECIVRCLERGIETIRNPRAWLFQTLYHTFVSEYRRSSRRQTPFEGSPEAGRDPMAPLNALPDPIPLEDVRRAIEILPQDLRTVVWLSDAEEFRLREIAEILAWPLGTVGSRLSRARQELRRLLAAYQPPPERQA